MYNYSNLHARVAVGNPHGNCCNSTRYMLTRKPPETDTSGVYCDSRSVDRIIAHEPKVVSVKQSGSLMASYRTRITATACRALYLCYRSNTVTRDSGNKIQYNTGSNAGLIYETNYYAIKIILDSTF